MRLSDGWKKSREEWLPVNLAEERENDRSLDQNVWSHVETKFPVDEPVKPDLPEALRRGPGFVGAMRFRLALTAEPLLKVFSSALAQERSSKTFFVWLPVFFGLGCLLYFNLPREPLVLAFPVAALICAVSTHWLAAGSVRRGICVGLGVLCLGASVSQMRTITLSTTMLSRAMVVDLAGVVEKVERRSDGRVRYTVLPDTTKHSKRSLPEGFHALVRVTARKGGPMVQTGERISGKARLAPSSGPSYPGGYSFAFQSWFQGIGASGFFLGAPSRSAALSPNAEFSVNGVREAMVGIIRDALPGQSGALASALIVGDRSGIDEKTAEALRLSGLAHILAISGLHMALLSATVIVLIRLGFASAGNTVLARPVKKWAAASAFVAASVYLVLSGGSVATQRAWIMVSIMLIAVMLDQRALTMRNVSIAALIVLALTPEAILMPGFQMSFAAVAALVASYDVLSKRARRRGTNAAFQQRSFMRRFIVRDVGGLAMTSLVAGIATGLFAAYHFHRVAPLGLFANLAAMPLVSLIVMPLALISVLAMPFGLEAYPLALMAAGVDGVVMVATWISENGPSGNTGRLPVVTLGLATGGLLLLCLMKTRLRLTGVVFLLGAGLSTQSLNRPDVLILENGGQVGVFSDGGELVMARPRAEKFSTAIWKRAFPTWNENGIGEKAPANNDAVVKGLSRSNVGQFLCDPGGCSITSKGVVITHVRMQRNLVDDCYLADILVLAFKGQDVCSHLPEADRPLIIDRPQLQRFGAHSLTLTKMDKPKSGNLQSSSGTKKPEPILVTNPTGSGAGVAHAGMEGALSSKRARLREAVKVERAFEGQLRPWTQHRSLETSQ